MKILVLGGTGFLGQNLQEVYSSHEIAKNHEYIFVGSKDCNLTNAEETKKFIRDYNPSCVVNLAAKAGGLKFNKTYPADLTFDNLKIQMNVFESLKELRFKLVNILTTCIYPKFCPLPFNESNIWNGFPEETNSGYAMAKKMALVFTDSYHKQYAIKNIINLIPANLFGKFDHFDKNNSHVIPALIAKFVHAIRNNLDAVECWGTGMGAAREFLDSALCAEAIITAIHHTNDIVEPLNIGSGREIFIKDLAELIAKLTGFKGKIVFTGEVGDGQPRRQLCTEKAEKLLGWKAKTSLEDGLKKTIEWYEKNYE